MHSFGARRVGLHEVEEPLGEFVGGAAIDEFLLNAVKFREFAEDGFAAEFAEEIGDIAEGGVRGDAAEAIGATAFQSDGKCRERSRRARDAISFNEAREGLLEAPVMRTVSRPERC